MNPYENVVETRNGQFGMQSFAHSKEYFENIDPLHDWTDTPSKYEVVFLVGAPSNN